MNRAGYSASVMVTACALLACSSGPPSTAVPDASNLDAPPDMIDTPDAWQWPADLTGVLDEGDSISVFWSGNHTGIYANARTSLRYLGRAVGGSSINSGPTNLEARFAADSVEKPAVVTILIGANDLFGGPEDNDVGAAYWLDSLWTYVAKWKATGARVAVGTVLPLCYPQQPNYHNRHAARRPIVNDAIRQAVGTKIDAVIDYAADPVMGPDSAACDKSLYYDGIHPTDGAAAGQGKLALVYAPVVDALLVP